MTSQMKTLLSIVVDRSGSMESMGKETFNSINSFVNEQKNDNTNITLLRFDHECDRMIDNRPSNEFSITEDDIAPRGTTALYQAIGESIEYTKTISGEYQKVIFMIMTDGEENSSKGKFSGENGRKYVKELISKSESSDWQFYFLGANIDSQCVGDSLGFTPGHCIDFSPDKRGCGEVMRSCSQAVSRFRDGDTSEFNEQERISSRGTGKVSNSRH